MIKKQAFFCGVPFTILIDESLKENEILFANGREVYTVKLTENRRVDENNKNKKM